MFVDPDGMETTSTVTDKVDVEGEIESDFKNDIGYGRTNSSTMSINTTNYGHGIGGDKDKGDSTGVRKNPDGTYTVVSGNPDGDTGVYIADSNGNYNPATSSMIGQSVSDSSFLDDNGKAVEGAIINLSSTEVKDFLTLLIASNPSLPKYMPNATGGGYYDLKTRGLLEAKALGVTSEQHKYRGSMSLGEKTASGRDGGNLGAGLVAGRAGISWLAARLAFDALETYQKSSITTTSHIMGTSFNINIKFRSEAPVSKKAQKEGWKIGNKLK